MDELAAATTKTNKDMPALQNCAELNGFNGGICCMALGADLAELQFLRPCEVAIGKEFF